MKRLKDSFPKKNRRTLIILAAILAVAVIGGFSIFSHIKSTTSIISTISLSSRTTLGTFSSGSSDYRMFIAPYRGRIENLRAYLMSPPDFSAQPYAKIGYNSEVDLIQVDYLCGGPKDDFSLDDPNLILGQTLDYLNSLKGISTHIDETTRAYLTQSTFSTNYPNSQYGGCAANGTGAYTYQNNDRREYIFGKNTPAYPADVQGNACVEATSGVVFYVAGNNIFAAEVPSGCISLSPSRVTGMNAYAMQINYLWLKGDSADRQTATQMFLTAVDNWVSVPGAGIGGTTGGYFTDAFDSGSYPGTHGNCKSERSLAYFTIAARATGLWQYNSTVTQVVQQVLNAMWAQQNPDGSIGVSIACTSKGGVIRDSGESDGLTLVSTDPRLPGWFA